MPRKSKLDRATCEEAATTCACFNFRKASRAVTQLFDEALQPTGLRSTQFVILVSIFLDEPATVPAMAKKMVMDRTTLSRNLKPLEAAGLIESGPSTGGRTKLYRVTADGQKLAAEALPLWRSAQERFVAQIGQRKWGSMIDSLSSAIDAARLS